MIFHRGNMLVQVVLQYAHQNRKMEPHNHLGMNFLHRNGSKLRYQRTHKMAFRLNHPFFEGEHFLPISPLTN